jgi:hypothetical protein
MSAEQNLESAGANLRAASASMPFPQMRVRKPIRQGFMAFAAGLAVALMIGVPLYLTRTSPPDGAPVAAPGETTTTGSLGTTTTSVPPSTTTESAAPACGTELPYQVTLPEDFIGPMSGPAPHGPHPAEDGQLVMHWLGRGGSVEIRWPANQEYFERAEWGSEPVWGGPDMDFALFFSVIPAKDEWPAEIGGFELLPTDLMTGPCDAIQVVTYGPGYDGVLGRRGVAYGANGVEELTIYPDLLRPRDKVLVVETLETTEVPEVVECQDGPGVEDVPPNKAGTTPDSSVFDTPEEALQDILGTDIAETWPNVGYFELVAPDGTVTYGNPLDDNSPDPRPDNGLVISVTVIEVEGGWTVTEWETSGC